MKLTREQWLHQLKDALAPDFKRVGFPLPSKLRISVGWPLGRALANPRGNRTVGECFNPKLSKDKHHEIFISPCLGKAEEVDHVLLHELVHAAVGTEHGHKGQFKRVAIELGLVGKMRSTKAGPKLKERLNELTKSIGRYPHGKLDISKVKKQGTRMLKLECASCGYVVRTTAKWVEIGMPSCCCGGYFNLKD